MTIKKYITDMNVEDSRKIGAKDKVKRRVRHCKEAGNEVVQQKESDGSWLCLHNDTKEQDLKEVEKFRKKKLKKSFLSAPIEKTRKIGAKDKKKRLKKSPKEITEQKKLQQDYLKDQANLEKYPD